MHNCSYTCRQDGSGVVRALVELGVIKPQGDMLSIRRAINYFIENIKRQTERQETIGVKGARVLGGGGGAADQNAKRPDLMYGTVIVCMEWGQSTTCRRRHAEVARHFRCKGGLVLGRTRRLARQRHCCHPASHHTRNSFLSLLPPHSHPHLPPTCHPTPHIKVTTHVTYCIDLLGSESAYTSLCCHPTPTPPCCPAQAIGEDLFAIALDQPFRFPATFTFVLRAFSTLEVGKLPLKIGNLAHQTDCCMVF